MRTPLETIDNGDLRAEIFADEDPVNPREWDNIGVMICGHKRYTLGDEQLKTNNFGGWDEVQEYLTEDRHAVVMLPLYLYDHSGLSMSTNRNLFSAMDSHGWDWGIVGFIYATAEKVKKEYGDGPDAVERATKYLEGEVRNYDSFLRGDIYGVNVTKTDKCDHGTDHREDVDSCWGMIGFDYAKEEAQRMLETAKEAAGKECDREQ